MNKHHTAGLDRRTTVTVAAGLAALALLVWLVVGQTTAAFTAQTSNADNAFTTGSVTITSSQSATALFNLPAMLPGHSDTKTITITNASSAPLGVRLFAGSYTAPTRAGSELADELEVTIDLLDADDSSVIGNVFTGSMTEFVAASDWQCGFWTETDANECDPAPSMGPLEALLRQVIPDTMENSPPFDTAFWTAVKSADTAVVNQLKGVDNVTQPAKDRQPAAEAWALPLLDDVKDAIATADQDTYDQIEQAIEDSPTVGEVAPIPTVAPSMAPSTPAEAPYPDLGDRLEETGQPDSARIYRIKVKLADDAGQANVDPADSLSLAFIWEGRA